MKKIILITLLLGSIIFVSCKKSDDPQPSTPNTINGKKDTSHIAPKVYDEIWVVNHGASTSGITQYDSLKVTKVFNYIEGNGDSCYTKYCDTVRTSNGILYTPEIFVNFTQGTSYFKYTIVDPYSTTIWNMYYGGITSDNKEITFIMKEDAQFPNTTIVFDRIK